MWERCSGNASKPSELIWTGPNLVLTFNVSWFNLFGFTVYLLTCDTNFVVSRHYFLQLQEKKVSSKEMVQKLSGIIRLLRFSLVDPRPKKTQVHFHQNQWSQDEYSKHSKSTTSDNWRCVHQKRCSFMPQHHKTNEPLPLHWTISLLLLLQ